MLEFPITLSRDDWRLLIGIIEAYYQGHHVKTFVGTIEDHDPRLDRILDNLPDLRVIDDPETV